MMCFRCISAILALFIPLSFSTILVDAPLAISCQPTQLVWQGGIAPWVLSILSASSPNPSLADFEPANASNITWNVLIPPGTAAIVQVKDKLEEVGVSAPFIVQEAGEVFNGGCFPGKNGPTPSGSAGTSEESSRPAISDGSSSSVTPTKTSTSTSASSTTSSDSSSQPVTFIDSTSRVSVSSSTFGTGRDDATTTTTNTIDDQPSASDSQSSSTSSNFSRNSIMTGSIIGGAIAGVLCTILIAFCVIRRCRRRHQSAEDRLAYPFSPTNSPVTRQVAGRSGQSPSAFSSWGNQGALSEEAISLSSPVMMTNTRGQPLEAEYGTIESRYAAAFIPGHQASSLSIDRSDPGSQTRFRGGIPRIMTDTSHYGPSESSAAIIGEQPHAGSHADTYSPPSRVIGPREPFGATGLKRSPIVVAHPPPYTSY